MPTRIIRPAKGTGLLDDLIKRAFNATCEAEKIAHAGPKGNVYANLLDAHSALLRAKNGSPSPRSQRNA